MYRRELTRRAQRDLDKLSGDDLERVVAVIRGLRNTPRPHGAKKIIGPIYRIRVGDWRIVYAVFDKDRLVIVGKVAKRCERTYEGVEELF
ncbi:MAG TPA: type II toxin-antitoxin system RelE/ParE family toxin [Dehalococcoidia bacterium]|nr:type II toxin-antitoxin system RelE/ParE family toxin [Dehalococcoidia bacterium]